MELSAGIVGLATELAAVDSAIKESAVMTLITYVHDVIDFCKRLTIGRRR